MAIPLRVYLLVGQLSDTPSRASWVKTGVWGKCPRCEDGKLFSGWIRVNDQCEACGLDFTAHEKGDGPAFFAITIIGALVCALAAAVELIYQPPYWIHALLWLPCIILGSLVILRIAKAMLITMQYNHQFDSFYHDDI